MTLIEFDEFDEFDENDEENIFHLVMETIGLHINSDEDYINIEK